MRARTLALAGILAAGLLAVGLLAGCGGSSSRRPATTAPAAPTSSPAAPTPSPAAPTPAPPSAGPTSTPPPAGERFGVNVNRLFNGRTYSPAQINAQLAAVRATGATVARSDALWEATEPAPPVGGRHSYDWRFDDAIAASLAAQGLQWLPIIDYSAPWAQSIPGQDHSPPASPSDYAAYAAALAGRFGRGGSFWSSHPSLHAPVVDTIEIWNEPNSASFWFPAPDASRYDTLYLRARDAVLAIDPTARVIVGGMAHPGSYLQAMLAARPDLRGHIDGVGVHPYGPTPQAVLEGVVAARHDLRALGLGAAPLYATEFGWTTHPSHDPHWLPERLRPSYIRLTLGGLGHLGCGLAASFLYTWVTPERGLGDPGDWFGIARPTGGRTADTVAFAAGLRAAVAPGPKVADC